MIEKAERLKKLPPYLFKEIDQKKEEVKKRGVDIIDLGVGDPDLPTPPHIVEALKKAAEDPQNHRYPSYSGMNLFRDKVAEWYKKRFGVDLEPEKEVLTLIGSKEGIAHLPLAFVNPFDLVLVPSPAYPVYKIGTIFAGGEPFAMPLLKENGFLPDFEEIPEEVLKKAKLLFINYPNNPTAAVADTEFFKRAVELGRKYNILICHDLAYSEMCFDGYRPSSILEIPHAKEVAIEFHSLSKTYNMTGWRIGFAVGNQEAIAGLGAIKSNVDSGAFQAVQFAGIAALEGDQSCVEEMRAIYTKRRDIMVSGLRSLGFSLDTPKATFYLWVEVPQGFGSAEFAKLLLEKAGIVVTPGNGFGEPGEGFFRIALTQKEDRLNQALERLSKIRF
jgi:LL-diaminopimelate aminotransferase